MREYTILVTVRFNIDENRPPTQKGIEGLVGTALDWLHDDLNEYYNTKDNLDSITGAHIDRVAVITERKLP